MVVERLELRVATLVSRLAEAERVAAVRHVGHPFAELLRVERRLRAADRRTGQPGRFAGNRVGPVAAGQVVVEREPERGAGAGRTSGGRDAAPIGVPLAGLRPQELD